MGIALEDFSGTAGATGKILCFVHIGGNQEAYAKELAELRGQNRKILEQNAALRREMRLQGEENGALKENLASLKALVCGDHPDAAICR